MRSNNNWRAQDTELDMNQHLRGSLDRADESLEINRAIMENLMQQERMTKKMKTQLSVLLMSKFVKAKEVMSKIKTYKNRDSMVLAFVFAVCLFFMFIYWLNK